MNFIQFNLQRTSAYCRYLIGFHHHRRKTATSSNVQRQFESRSLSSAPVTSPDTSVGCRSNKDITTDNNYSTPLITDEGIKIFQADPNTASSGLGLTWGSVLWPSGSCLAKYLYWKQQQQQRANDDDLDVIDNSTRILELGCGTGVVGLTCAKIGARHVTLSDSASELWPLLRKSIEANDIDTTTINIYNLDWRDPSTFLNPSITKSHQESNRYDLVVAADVLYAGMDGLFARTLASHLPSSDEIDGQKPPVAIIACPFRTDSPLFNFFGIVKRLGLELDRLEDGNGSAAGAAPGTNLCEAFYESSFVPLCGGGEGEEKIRWRHVATDPTFSLLNHDRVQIFRVRRISGTSADARAIRRVGRI